MPGMARLKSLRSQQQRMARYGAAGVEYAEEVLLKGGGAMD